MISSPVRSRRTTPRGERSRERILREATRLFARYGYDGVSMRMLGDAAGLDASSLYKHLSGKAELAREIFESVARQALDCMQSLKDPCVPSLEQLLHCALALDDYYHRTPEAARLLVMVMTTPPDSGSGLSLRIELEETERASVQIFLLWQRWMRRAVRAHAIRRVDPLEAFVNFFGMLTFRPATAGILLASQDRGRSATARRKARIREIEAFVGSFAPDSERDRG